MLKSAVMGNDSRNVVEYAEAAAAATRRVRRDSWATVGMT
jgi:hypothetical protein